MSTPMAPSVQRSTVHHQRPSTELSARESVGIRRAPNAGVYRSGRLRFGGRARRVHTEDTGNHGDPPRKRSGSAASRSSDLQRRQTDHREDHRDDPKPDHDSWLRPALLFEVMMQRRHQEDAPAGTLVPEHLDDDGDRLQHEQAADDEEYDF